MKFFSWCLVLAGLFVATARAQTAPTIASISNSQRVIQGQSLSLSVSVNGTAPFTYQWKKAGTAITGATASTYTVETLALTDAGSYTVTITNATGSVTSGAILIDVIAATAPTFYYQSGSLVYTVGATLNLYASVSGTAPLTFVWKKDDVVIPGATTSNYVKADVTAADAGSYTVTVSNIAGSSTSPAFVVTVNPVVSPVFSSQPSSSTVDAGGYFSFYAYVSNSTGVTFQWYKDGVAISGATYSSYSKSNAQVADAGNYTVIATNTAGSTTSAVATLTLRPAVAPSNVSITNGPIVVTLGESLTLYSSVNGTWPLTYQWQKDGADIAGATSSSYYKNNITADDAGSYSLVVTNSVGSASSGSTSVSVSSSQGLIITAHPQSITVYPGDAVSFQVNATGSGTLSYQWQKDGASITGATNSYYSLSPSANSSAGTYTVVVTNAQGSVTSRPATLTVLDATAPAILTQPASVSVQPGQAIQLSVSASGHPSPTYQWQKDGVAIVGATSSSYYKWGAASSDSGSYTVVVSNSAGSVTSSAAEVTVSAGAAPVITSHPASASLLPGDSFSGLWVGVENDQGVSVQWFRDGVEIPGATGTSYYISNAQPAQAGTYHAVVTNTAGSVTSLDGVITVDLSSARPVITYVSGSQTVTGGSYPQPSINLAPTVTNYTVAWKKDGVQVPNATQLYLSFSNFGLSGEGTYTAEVTTSAGTFTSRPMVLALRHKGELPHFIRQPVSATRDVGDGIYFSTAVDGEAPFAYQWRKDGVDIPGATGDSYNLYNVVAAYAGNYTLVVTNRNGSITSNIATLAINTGASTAPIISYQPISQTLTEGLSSLNLSVGVLNYGYGQTFQWYKDGTAIQYATSSYYSSYNVTTSTAGRYKVVITSPSGFTVTSDEAVIVVTKRATGPSFTTQPSDQTAYAGGSVTFTAAATGGTVTYQWRKNGVSISGATSATLTLNNLTTADEGSYTVVAQNADGSTASAIAELTVLPSLAPTITSQPTSQVGGRLGSVSFTVVATGSPAPTYQWKKNGTNIPGATTATLSLTSLVTADAGNYSVVVSNAAGSVTSDQASLTVYDQQPYAPAFTTQPEGGTYVPGASVTLIVAVSGFPVPTLQWYKNGSAISGAHSTMLSLGKMSAGVEGQYYAVATNDLGTAASRVATLVLGVDPVRLVNVSARGTAGKDSNTMIAGLVINGTVPKTVMIRAIGPSLVPLGVTNALANPRLRLFKGSDVIQENDDWSSADSATEIAATASRLGAFPLATGTLDSALIARLEPGVYTAHVTTADASTGTVLLEVYDADNPGDSDTRIVNLSSRGPVGTGDDILIVGFVINGSAPKKVLLRGVGPALTPLGVTGALADPTLQLYSGTKLVNENDNWSAGADAADIAAAAKTCGAMTLDPGTKDAAILVELQPGVYSAHVRGAGGATGVALVEVYEVP